VFENQYVMGVSVSSYTIFVSYVGIKTW